jgi:hypothetical protein
MCRVGNGGLRGVGTLRARACHSGPAGHGGRPGLTSPQGLAFARLAGRQVLYVGESDQIDRYPWGSGGVSGPRTVIAAHLPDLDPAGDDVHREKDVAVAPDGTCTSTWAVRRTPVPVTGPPRRRAR